MKKLAYLIPVGALLIGLFTAGVGDSLTSVMIDGTSGVIQNKQTLTHSNALRVTSAPAASNDVVRWQDMAGATNATLSASKAYTDSATNNAGVTATVTISSGTTTSLVFSAGIFTGTAP